MTISKASVLALPLSKFHTVRQRCLAVCIKIVGRTIFLLSMKC